MTFKLPKLNYDYGDLEPFIDAKTVEIHYSKHHQSYIDKLNSALENYPEHNSKTLEEILSNLNSIPEEIRLAVRNNGGGTFNHNFFWQIMQKPNKEKTPQKEMEKALIQNFGSFEKFKEEFSKIAVSHFASGWAWLHLNKENKMEIISTPNHDSPIMQNLKPIIVLDLWEHAYYLKYKNRRPEFIENWWNLLNWTEIEKVYLQAVKHS